MKVLGLILVQFLSFYDFRELKSCEKTIAILRTDFKIKQDAQPQPQMLTFESKVVNQPLQTVFKLPEKDGIELSFITKSEKDDKKKIKIPLNGNFQVIFEKASTVSKKKDDDDKKATIIDNDATDGTATIQLPESIMEGFIKVKNENEDDDKKSNQSKLTVEDKLYYSKTELNVLKPNEKKEKDDKEKWYKLGSKIFPVPEDFHSDDGSKYILSFENTGTKTFAMKWYKSRKFDYPVGTSEITPEKGGVVELQGVGRLEIPAGAVDKPTIVKMKQELNAPEMLYDFEHHSVMGDTSKLIGTREYDFISSVVRLEPFGLDLKQRAVMYLETDKARLGNNMPTVIHWQNSQDKRYWELQADKDGRETPFEKWTDNMGTYIEKFQYYTKTITAYMTPTANFKSILIEVPVQDNLQIQSFRAKGIIYVKVFEVNYIDRDFGILGEGNIEIVKQRIESAYNHFLRLSKLNENSIIEANKVNNGYVVIDIRPSFYNVNGLSIAKNVGTNGCKIDLDAYGKHSIEHELWHAFQYTKYGGSKVDLNKWVAESSAEHMGARQFNRTIGEGSDIFSYSLNLTENLSRLKNSSTLNIEANEYSGNDPKGGSNYVKTYHAAGFFTFLGSKKTSLEKDTNNKDLPQKVEDEHILDTVINPHLEKYHEFAVHAYIADRFNIRFAKVSDPTSDDIKLINKNNMSSKNKSLCVDIKSTKPLPSLSSKYFEIKPDSTLHGNIAIVVKPDKDLTPSTIKITAIHETSTGEKIIKELPLGKETSVVNFKVAQDKLILVVSNSNVTLNGNSSNYDMKVSYSCSSKKYGIASYTGGCQ